jgi:transposase
MLIIGCDYHPSMQPIAWVDTESGECGERQLRHGDGEAEKFYRELQQRRLGVRVALEATGHTRWFECLLAELQMELWIGRSRRDSGQAGTQAEDRAAETRNLTMPTVS